MARKSLKPRRSRFTYTSPITGKRRTQMIPIGALVCIKWIDAEETPGWDHGDVLDKKAWLMATYGLWRGWNKYFAIYGDTRLENDHWGGDRRIPIGMITEVVLLDPNPYAGEWLDGR